jgi:hypothetical protein|tara:strand:- start:733 stop:1017 length:285 start_codon:yes stop_codon:yes gene_type:complete
MVANNNYYPMDDAVSPEHYKFNNGIETIDYILAVCAELDGDEAALVTNILKYVSRYRGKGTPKRDLQKAAWYLERLQQEVYEKEVENYGQAEDE